MVDQILPPQNIEAEEAILGGCLLDPEAFSKINGVIKSDSFYVRAHQDIFNAIADLASKHQPTDLMFVTTYLADRGLLDQVGGTSKLAQLVDSTVSAVNVDRYAILVEDKAQRRRLINTTRRIAQSAYDGSIDLAELLEQAEKEILSLRQELQPSSGYWADITARMLDYLEKVRSDKTIRPCIRTRVFPDFDESTNFLPGDLAILLGSSGSCKTAFSNQLMIAWAQQNIPVFYWSREMQEESMWARGTAVDTSINSLYLGRRPDKLTDGDLNKVIGNLEMSTQYPLWLHFQDNYVAAFNHAQQKFREFGHGDIKVMVVDYLQLIAGNDTDSINAWLRELKLFAVDRKILVFLLAQPCDLSQRNDKRPSINDISYAKTARETPDFVFGWYCPSQWEDDTVSWYKALDRGWEVFEMNHLKTRHQGGDKLVFAGDPSTCQFIE